MPEQQLWHLQQRQRVQTVQNCLLMWQVQQMKVLPAVQWGQEEEAHPLPASQHPLPCLRLAVVLMMQLLPVSPQAAGEMMYGSIQGSLLEWVR